MLVRQDMTPDAEMAWLEQEAAAAIARGKRKTPSNPERTQQQAVVGYLRQVLPPGSIVQCVKNEAQPRSQEAHARARFHSKRKKDGYEWGFPDLLVLVPPGRSVLVEMKAPKTGRLSDDQRAMHDKLRAAGFFVGVATSIDTARELMRRAGIPLREAA